MPSGQEVDVAAGEDRGYDTSVYRPPLRPQRRLLVGTAVVLVTWLGFLLYLYFTTIYPQAGQLRKVGPQPLTDIPGPAASPTPVRPATVPTTPLGPAAPLGPVGPVGPAAPVGPSGSVPR